MHDCRVLTPLLQQPGEHILQFMKRIGIKEKNMFKLCTGVQYLKLNQGEFACHFGERDIQSRKMMILLDGTLAVNMPLPPDVMLSCIRDIIDQHDRADEI